MTIGSMKTVKTFFLAFPALNSTAMIKKSLFFFYIQNPSHFFLNPFRQAQTFWNSIVFLSYVLRNFSKFLWTSHFQITALFDFSFSSISNSLHPSSVPHRLVDQDPLPSLSSLIADRWRNAQSTCTRIGVFLR